MTPIIRGRDLEIAKFINDDVEGFSHTEFKFSSSVAMICDDRLFWSKTMSKKTVFDFLSKAARDEQLKSKLQDTTTPHGLVTVGSEAGYDFSTEHVDDALTELKQKPGFFKFLAEAALEIFSPDGDNYPATGVQPFSGDPNPKL